VKPDVHPTACAVCERELPLRDEPRGRPRLYCSGRCRQRSARLNELRKLASGWAAKGRADMVARVERRIEIDLLLWRAAGR
jgi:hypothetical protein